MTPQQLKAMKLALEALNDMACWQEGREVDIGFDEPYAADTSRKAITAINEVLAEHAMRETQRLGQEIEQEPVGAVKDLFTQAAWEKLDVRGSTKVYLDTPPQRTWVGLNDDEIDYLIHLAYTGDEEFVQTIEAKLKEKNT